MRPQEALDMLELALDAARYSLERQASRAGPRDYPTSPYLDMAMQLEPVRFRVTSADFRRQSEDEAYRVTVDALQELSHLNRSSLFEEYGRTFPFRTSRPLRAKSASARREIDVLVKEGYPFSEGLRRLCDLIEQELHSGNGDLFSPPNEDAPSPSSLRRIVPAQQQIAPVQFDIRVNRLVIKHQPATAARFDRENVESAKSALLAAGDRILTALKDSNDDRRLGEALKEIQSALSSEQDIINLGLLNLTLDAVRESLEGELANPVNGLLKAHTVNLSMFVAQFPEWQRFNEQAEKVALETGAIVRIKQATDQLVNELRGRDDTVDPEVPRTIAALNALIANPARASKRAVLAVIRSVENLIARAYQALAEFAENTSRDTLDGLSKAISKNAVRILVGIALASAAHLIPATSSLHSSAWVKTATEIVRHQIEKLERE